ncbi:WD-40 repeat protein [Reticulomyxa filosa]|uniref:WD-40 repeat protein n=1 Tax=Reticulomyxa filosa TaxID=46433 RepID=X6P6C5_RETFI|nr:WD-40 repeat protein [Reticulomyxa filosa]|eukprot:ETO33639.1 WD-40 repeat protein [Reticulomyxa filosa]
MNFLLVAKNNQQIELKKDHFNYFRQKIKNLIFNNQSQLVICVPLIQPDIFLDKLKNIYFLKTMIEIMALPSNEKQVPMQQPLVKFISVFQKTEEENLQVIIQHWIRTLNIKLGWIHDFDKLVVNYVMFFFFAKVTFMFDTFRSSSKLLKTFTGHTDWVNSVDFLTCDDGQFLCSGSDDGTVCVWDADTNERIKSFNGNSGIIYCAKFSQYDYYNYSRRIIFASSDDEIIRAWDIENDRQLQIFKGHTQCVSGIEFSSFNSGRYLCSGSYDNTVRLWDVETSKSLHVFNGHKSRVYCVDISPLQSNNNNNNNNNNDNDKKCNNIGVIGGNGYTICSGSEDNIICVWDIETAKRPILFTGHDNVVNSVKYGSNKLGNIGGANTILSASNDKSVRLWDIRSGRQIQVFNRHLLGVTCAAYSPLVVNNIEIGGYLNVICSGSLDNAIRFWDIRSNKKKLYVINGDYKEDDGIRCLTFVSLQKTGHNNEQKSNNYCDVIKDIATSLFLNKFGLISIFTHLKFRMLFL